MLISAYPSSSSSPLGASARGSSPAVAQSDSTTEPVGHPLLARHLVRDEPRTRATLFACSGAGGLDSDSGNMIKAKLRHTTVGYREHDDAKREPPTRLGRASTSGHHPPPPFVPPALEMETLSTRAPSSPSKSSDTLGTAPSVRCARGCSRTVMSSP
jgi:hypothetical protein